MSEWISRKDRLPEKEDGDAQGCVLAWHEFNGAEVVGADALHIQAQTPGWQRVREDKCFTHWMRLPGKPGAGGSNGID